MCHEKRPHLHIHNPKGILSLCTLELGRFYVYSITLIQLQRLVLNKMG
jgi:hypothetical protein